MEIGALTRKESSLFEETVKQMIAEQGDVWAGTDNRQGHDVLVTDRPDRCFRLVRLSSGEWVTTIDHLSVSDMEEFFAAFGSHWNVLLKSYMQMGDGSLVKVRAFIKNGRRVGRGWSISIDASPMLAKGVGA